MPHFLKRIFPDPQLLLANPFQSFRRDNAQQQQQQQQHSSQHDLHRSRRVLTRNNTSSNRLSFFDTGLVNPRDLRRAGQEEDITALRYDGASIAASSSTHEARRHILAPSVKGDESGRGGVQKTSRARRRLSKRHRRPASA